MSPMDITKTVKGLYFNSNENICSFILSDGQDWAAAGGDSGIDIKDLAVALYVFCNDNIKSKNISFSLDAVDERNPDGDFQKKVVWPDESEGRPIIAGTRFSEIMFEADWVMK